MFYVNLMILALSLCSGSMILFPAFWRKVFGDFSLQPAMWRRASDTTYRLLGLALLLFLAFGVCQMPKP